MRVHGRHQTARRGCWRPRTNPIPAPNGAREQTGAACQRLLILRDRPINERGGHHRVSDSETAPGNQVRMYMYPFSLSFYISFSFSFPFLYPVVFILLLFSLYFKSLFNSFLILFFFVSCFFNFFLLMGCEL